MTFCCCRAGPRALKSRKRIDGRPYNYLRKVKITPNYLSHPAGSALIEMGGTKVICAVSVEPGVPG